MIVLAEALRCEERFQEAERAIDCALQHVGTDKEYKEADKRVSQRLALERGLIQRLSNRFPNAIETFRQMLVEVEADPVLYKDSSISGTIWWNLAAVLYETSDYEGAAAAFEKALTLHPHDEPYHHKILQSLGDCYFGIAAYAKAREAYEKVIASAYSWDAEKLKACAGVAKVLYKSGMYAQAASAFETVLPDCRNDGPDYYNFLLWLGGCYEGMRNIAKARDNYEKVANATCVWDADKISAQEALMRLSSSGGSQVRH
jgi:tetratricopeptide (TPR) repeat protein